MKRFWIQLSEEKSREKFLRLKNKEITNYTTKIYLKRKRNINDKMIKNKEKMMFEQLRNYLHSNW